MSASARTAASSSVPPLIRPSGKLISDRLSLPAAEEAVQPLGWCFSSGVFPHMHNVCTKHKLSHALTSSFSLRLWCEIKIIQWLWLPLLFLEI